MQDRRILSTEGLSYQPLEQTLLEQQNPDGGWGFHSGHSWTEPTALALLALQVAGNQHACKRAAQWLINTQRADGGWAPQPGVDYSTWLTSLVALSLFQQDWPVANRNRALAWIRNQVRPPESFLVTVLRRLNNQPLQAVDNFGKSWFPGTAPWLYPTSIAVLCFQRWSGASQDRELESLGRKGQQFILSRRCNDGGWNHGGARSFEEDPASYPEMTGLALLALKGIPLTEISRPLRLAKTMMSNPASGEGVSWLQMGLQKHGIAVSAQPPAYPCRNTRDISLRLLALTAGNTRNSLVANHSL